MATKSATALAGFGAAERLATSTLRFFAEFAGAVTEGVRARNDYNERVGHGADPVKAAEAAVRYAAEQH